MLDVNRLLALVQVEQAGSITGAAERLSLTPAAVSQQLSKLEREVGSPLMHRHARGAKLTPMGRALATQAEVVVGELRLADEIVRELSGNQTSAVAVGTFASAGQTLVPIALAGFRRQHPDVSLHLLALEPPEGYGLVRSRALDLLLTHSYPGVTLPEARGLHRELLLVDPLRLVLPAQHPALRRHKVRFDLLAQEDWISGSPGVPNRVALERMARNAGVDVHVAYETSDYQVTQSLIAAGLGVSVLPASIIDTSSDPRLAARAIADDVIARKIYLVHHKKPTSAVVNLIEVFKQQASVRP